MEKIAIVIACTATICITKTLNKFSFPKSCEDKSRIRTLSVAVIVIKAIIIIIKKA